ncbi:MAG TPA: sugar ABC transporter permease [bacterium]|nr:sugar ABC transporter permease [bacterium]
MRRSFDRAHGRRQEHGAYLLMLLPTFFTLCLFFYYPAGTALYYSFFDWDGENAWFIGIQNFVDMWFDPVLHISLVNLAIYVVLSLAVGLAMPWLGAELIFGLRRSSWRSFFQFSFLVPTLVPGIVVILLWQFMYDPSLGLLNAALETLGLGERAMLWLGSPKTALYCFVGIGFPWVSGTSVLILLSGLNAIPTSVHEYARLEGVGAIRRAWEIDFQFLVGQIRLLAITGCIGLMQSFGLQLILTLGGPGTSTMVPGYHMYLNAFSYDRLGYASALGLFIAAIILLLTVVTSRFLRTEEI